MRRSRQWLDCMKQNNLIMETRNTYFTLGNNFLNFSLSISVGIK